MRNQRSRKPGCPLLPSHLSTQTLSRHYPCATRADGSSPPFLVGRPWAKSTSMNLRLPTAIPHEEGTAKSGELQVRLTSTGTFLRALLRQKRSLLTTILMAAFICTAGSIAAVESTRKMQSAAGEFELRPGVIVDAGRGVVFVMDRNREIDADDLSSGKVLWSTTIAAKPLLTFDDRLVAQAETHNVGTLPIVVLNSQTGQSIFEAAIPLPAGVSAFIDDRLGAQFSVTAQTKPAALFFSWRSTRTVISGVYRPGAPETHEIQWCRANRVFTTGQIQSMNSNELVESRDQWPATVQHLVDSRALLMPPWRAGSLILGAQRRGDRIVLERWDGASGQALSNIELQPGFSVAFASSDNQVILTRKAIGADRATGQQNYEWAMYSLETGQPVAKIRMPISAAPFFIWHSILVYESRPYGRLINGTWTEEPLELRALDMRTGADSWKVLLRDTAYRGQPPPHP